MIRISLILGTALLIAGCTPTPAEQAAIDARADARLASAIGDRVPGAPQDCIDPSMIDGPQVIAPDTIIYRENASRLWVNTVEGCPFLRNDTILIVDLYGTNMCRNDRFRTLDRGSSIPGAYCRFSTFTPFDRPAR